MSNQVRFMGVNVTMKWLLCFVVLVLTAALLFPVLLEASAEKDAAIAEAEAAIDDIPDPVEMEDMMTIRIARHLVDAALDLGAVEGEIDNYADLVDAEEAIEALFSDDFMRRSILALSPPPPELNEANWFVRNRHPRWWEDGHFVNGMCFRPLGSLSVSYDVTFTRFAEYDISDLDYKYVKGYAGIADDGLREDYPLTFQIHTDGDLVFEEVLEYGEYAVYYLLDIEGKESIRFGWYAETTDGDFANEIVVVEPQFFIPKTPAMFDAITDAENAIAVLPAEPGFEDEDDIKAARALVEEAFALGVEKEGYIDNLDDLIAAEEALDELYYETYALESQHVLGDPGSDNRSSGWFVDYENTDRWDVNDQVGDRGFVNFKHFAPLKVFTAGLSAVGNPDGIYAEWDISEYDYHYIEGYFGISDMTGNPDYPLDFAIWGDGEPIYELHMEYGDEAVFYRVNIEDVELLRLMYRAERVNASNYAAWPVFVEPMFLIPFGTVIEEAEEAIDNIPDPVSMEDMLLIRIARYQVERVIEGGGEVSEISNYDDLVAAEEGIAELYNDYMRNSILDLDIPAEEDIEGHTIFVRNRHGRWWEDDRSINGLRFLPLGSVTINYTTIGLDEWPEGRYAEYDISGRGYKYLKGYAGIDDNSLRHDYPTTFQVHADGDLVFEEVLEFGEYPAFYFLDIEGVEKVRFGWFAEVTDDGRANQTVAVEPQFFKPVDQEMLDAIAAAEAAIDELPEHISFVDEDQIKAVRAVVQEAYDLGVEKEGRIANLDDLIAAEEAVNDLYEQFFEKTSLLDHSGSNSGWPSNNVIFEDPDRWEIHDELGDMGLINVKSYAPLKAFTGNWTLPRDRQYNIEGMGYVYFEGFAGIGDVSTRMHWPLELRIYTDAGSPDDDPAYVSPPLEYGNDAVLYRVKVESAETLHFYWDAPWGYDDNRGNTPSFIEPHFLHSPKTAEAASLAEDAISELPDLLDLTEGDRSDVEEARAAVNNALFIGVDEGDIPNLDELEAIELRLDNLDDLPGLIDDAIAAIDSLPLPADITLDDQDDIEAARALVDDILAMGGTEGEITNLDVLEAAEEALQVLLGAIVTIGEAEGFTVDATVTVPVSVVNAAEMAGGEFVISYDPDIVTPTGIEKGELLEAMEVVYEGVQNSVVLEANFDYDTGKFKVIWASGISVDEAEAPAEGTLFYLEFAVNAAGESDLNGEELTMYDVDDVGSEEISSAWENGKITIEDVEYGDVNGDGKVNVADAIMVMQHILQIIELNAGQQVAADVNGDGVVDINDAVLIVEYVLELISEFPVED